jgi:hypothetical protein
VSEREDEVFGGVPAWLLAEYLVDLGGQRSGNEAVQGDGWSATLQQAARPPGSLSIGRVTVTVEGPKAGELMRRLREKAQRGGG